MNIRRETITITTDGSGDSTDYSQVYNGEIDTITYDGGLATGADFTITTETTGQTVLTITDAGTSAVNWSPRKQLDDNVGTAVGTIRDKIILANERLKIVTAQGGASDTGVIQLILT